MQENGKVNFLTPDEDMEIWLETAKEEEEKAKEEQSKKRKKHRAKETIVVASEDEDAIKTQGKA